MDEHDFPPCPKCNCATDRDGCMDSWCGWKRPATPDVLTEDEFRDLDQIVARLNEPRWSKVAADQDFADAVDALTALPRLLAEIRRLRAELAKLQQAKTRITAAMVKEVRERTGAGLLAARALLEATGGDVEKAVELARRGGGDGS